jgi:hypothetical protein
MGFTEDIAKVSEQVRKRSEQVVGEESTKQALILPFLSALGYDIWDPTEVMPEYISDAAKKKAGQFEKVDYAIAINETIVMLVEAKARGQKPEAHDGQLSRYFTWTHSAKVSIITNGIEYRFFTDLRRENIMDDEPFFSFNVLEYDSKDLENLKFFHRDNFDAAAIGSHAEEMVYLKSLTKLVGDLLRSPSEDFMRFLLSQLGLEGKKLGLEGKKLGFEGKINKKKIDKFEPLIKKSIQNSLVELMTRSLSQEIAQPVEADKPVEPDEIEEIEEEGSKVETTAEELEAFEKIKTIAASSKNHNLEVKYKDVALTLGCMLETLPGGSCGCICLQRKRALSLGYL